MFSAVLFLTILVQTEQFQWQALQTGNIYVLIMIHGWSYPTYGCFFFKLEYCFNWPTQFFLPKLIDYTKMLQQEFEIWSSLCGYRTTYRAFFTVPPNFQYQYENTCWANVELFLKECFWLATSRFSFRYWKLGGTVKNTLYVVPYPKHRDYFEVRIAVVVNHIVYYVFTSVQHD